MLNKNTLLLTGFLSFGILFADNPVVDGAEVSDANPDSSVSATEVVVAEVEVASESSSSDEDAQELGKVSAVTYTLLTPQTIVHVQRS